MESLELQSAREVVYSSRSDLLQPARLLRSMFRDLAACRELAWRLCVRDISARYRQSFLGYIWAFVPPLATTVPFVFLRSQGLFKTGETPIPYSAYVIIGVLLWQVFVDAIQCPLKTVAAAKPLLSKIQFPPEAILLAALGDVLFSFLIRLILLVGVFIWFGLTPPVTVLLVPLAVTALVALGFMIGVMVTPVGILYNDVPQALAILTTFWLFLTPVVYPAQETGLAGLLFRWNPVSPLITVGRDWLTTGATRYVGGFIWVSIFSLAMLFCGWVFYRIAMPHLVARIGN